MTLRGAGVVTAVGADGDRMDVQFSQAFGDGVAQAEVYAAVAEPLLPGLFQGQNAAIIGYGQTVLSPRF